MKTSDLKLLRAYAGNSDNDAFSKLVARHTNWLFAAARRRLEDDFLADDATQAVFMMLAQKRNGWSNPKESRSPRGSSMSCI